MKNVSNIRLGAAALILACAAFLLSPSLHAAEKASALKALFLGDNGPHRPAERFNQLEPVLALRGIELVYTDKLSDLNPGTLEEYDALVIYANQTRISSEQEKALLDFVAGGKGLVPIHCASYCFHNSPKYIELVGAQFRSHGTGVFREEIINRDHPITEDLKEIESWDETYVHHRHNQDRIVLAERVEGNHREPWTWVRTHGEGRVFYTAWGHDQRTWSNPDFQALIEQGIRWAAKRPPYVFQAKKGMKPFEYMEAPDRLPNYLAGQRWGTLGEAIQVMQKPLSPEDSLKHFVTLPQFEIELFAAEPEITKPICMAWDERGRLWIAETIDYPNEMQPPGKGRDRIKILEDTNGDGRADKFTVFAEQLSIPTSLVFANGGIIVAQAPHMLFLKDTTGDDRADVREILFTGWGTRDTHAGPSNLRWGFDNWIWGTVGYEGFNGTVGGKRHRFGMGFFRFKADGSELEFVRSSNNNTWGVALSEDGIIFGSTANNNASMYMPIANRYYEAVRGWAAAQVGTIADSQAIYPITDKVRQVDWHHRYTAAAGHALYTARNYPKPFWNRVALVAEPTGHLIGHYLIEPQGADFVARNMRSFLASDDEWNAPIMAEVGPDGAFWTIDWYNYIVQHNPTPAGFRTGRGNAYETTLRDKHYGRIHRVVYKGAKEVAPVRLESANPQQLVAVLKNDNMLWRMHAQRLLVERGQKDVVSSLIKLVRDRSVDEIGLNAAALHALWTLHGLDAFSDSAARAVAVAALKHPSAGVRRAAVSVLPRDSSSLEALFSAQMLNDSDAQVRLATLLALAEVPVSETVGPAILAFMEETENAKDRWLPHGAIAAAARHDASFLKAVLASAPDAPETAPERIVNLIANSSVEEERDGKPLHWEVRHYSGRAEQSLAEVGRTGSRSLQISSERGADSSWFTRAAVKPNTDYRLSAWIKTENVQNIGGAHGALLNVHEIQGGENRALTKAVTGTRDWTYVETVFNSGGRSEITINCLLGGWGASRGTAWYDDIQLVQTAPAALPGEVGQVVRIVTGHYAQRGPVESIVPTLLALKGASESIAIPILDGVVGGWPEAAVPQLSSTDEKALQALMRALPEAARDRLLALAQRWGRAEVFAANVAEITRVLRDQVGSGKEDERIAAARRWISLDDQNGTIEAILSQINVQESPSLASGFIGALTESRQPQTGAILISHWPKFTPASRRTALTTLFRRQDWTAALVESLESGAIVRADLAAEHWQQLRLNSDKALVERVQNLSAATNPDMEAVLKKLLPVAEMKGEIARGREVFQSACMNCHVFNGEGLPIGPDLTGIDARPRIDVLIDILDPNRSVESNYRLWSVTTKDGDAFSGRLESETQTTIQILDLSGQMHSIQRKDIEELEASSLSIMPSGFESLPPEDLAALLEYLAQPKQEAKN